MTRKEIADNVCRFDLALDTFQARVMRGEKVPPEEVNNMLDEWDALRDAILEETEMDYRRETTMCFQKCTADFANSEKCKHFREVDGTSGCWHAFYSSDFGFVVCQFAKRPYYETKEPGGAEKEILIAGHSGD